MYECFSSFCTFSLQYHRHYSITHRLQKTAQIAQTTENTELLDSCLAVLIFLKLSIMQIAKVQQLPFMSFVVFLPVPWKSVKNLVLLAGL